MEPGAKRGPAILYSALSVVLVVLVAALAFRARQPPPPQVAELTPQAQHQISKAPDQLSASPGSSAGGVGALGTTTTSTAAAAGSGVQSQAVSLPGGAPAAHHCYGNPPRQVAFDTQSPPCVAYWAGDNGGATARGATATQVSESGRYANDLQAFFSRTFELYGRQLHFVPVGEGGDCAAEQAQADGLAQQYKPFAAAYIWGGDPCLGAKLAHDQVIVAGFQDFLTSQVMRSEAPYLWQYPMAADQQLANMGAFACAHFAGGDAAYSPDPLFQKEKRRFGLIFQLPQTPYQVSVSPLTDRLSACGAVPAVTKTYQDTDANANEEAQKWDASAVESMEAVAPVCSRRVQGPPGGLGLCEMTTPAAQDPRGAPGAGW